MIFKIFLNLAQHGLVIKEISNMTKKMVMERLFFQMDKNLKDFGLKIMSKAKEFI
mgnify:CR=1 FL=1|jgi:hypothetical protein